MLSLDDVENGIVIEELKYELQIMSGEQRDVDGLVLAVMVFLFHKSTKKNIKLRMVNSFIGKEQIYYSYFLPLYKENARKMNKLNQTISTNDLLFYLYY